MHAIPNNLFISVSCVDSLSGEVNHTPAHLLLLAVYLIICCSGEEDFQLQDPGPLV